MTEAALPKPNRQARRKRETREKLLVAANRAFLAKGVDDTTANDITEAADVAYGTFYNYFKSVADIVPVVVEQKLLEHHEEVKKLQERYDDPVMRVAIGINTLFRRVMSGQTIKWLTQRPDVMADQLTRVVSKDAMEDIELGVASDDFALPCDYPTLRTVCVWSITGVLQDAAHAPDDLQRITEDMIQAYLRLLGVSDQKVREVIKYCPTLTD